MYRWLGVIVLLLLSTLQAGCAHVVVDPDGTRHITGFMVLTLPPEHQDTAADAVRMRTFGLTVTSGPTVGGQFTLGYSDTIIAAMRNDSLLSKKELRRALQEEHSEEP